MTHQQPDPEREVNQLRRRAETMREQAHTVRERAGQGQEPPSKQPDSADSGSGGWQRAALLVIGILLIVFGLGAMVRDVLTIERATPPPTYGEQQVSQSVDSCEAITYQITDPAGERLDPEQPPLGVMPVEDAESRTDQLLNTYLELNEGEVPAFLGGPILIDAQLPDDTSRPVWARLWVPDLGGAGDDEAVLLYVDAKDGEPLVLYRGLSVETPLLAGCTETGIEEFAERALSRGLNRVVIWVMYLAIFVFGIFMLTRWSSRRSRSANQ